MKYEDLRTKIKTGDLLAWSEGGSLLQWRTLQLDIIRAGTGSDINHVGIAYVADGRVFVVEAVVPEVRIYPLSKLLPFRYIRTPFTFKDDNITKLLSYVGTPYSKWEAIKSAFTVNTNNDKVIQCAKLANEIYKDFNVEFGKIKDTPRDVVNLMMDLYDTEEKHVNA